MMRPSTTYAETYRYDLAKIEELGLKTFHILRNDRGVGNKEEKYLGSVKLEQCTVRVYVVGSYSNWNTEQFLRVPSLLLASLDKHGNVTLRPEEDDCAKYVDNPHEYLNYLSAPIVKEQYTHINSLFSWEDI